MHMSLYLNIHTSKIIFMDAAIFKWSYINLTYHTGEHRMELLTWWLKWHLREPTRVSFVDIYSIKSYYVYFNIREYISSKITR